MFIIIKSSSFYRSNNFQNFVLKKQVTKSDSQESKLKPKQLESDRTESEPQGKILVLTGHE